MLGLDQDYLGIQLTVGHELRELLHKRRLRRDRISPDHIGIYLFHRVCRRVVTR